jgi:hypothetical protein
MQFGLFLTHNILTSDEPSTDKENTTTPVVYRNIASVVASCNTNNFFFSAKILNPQK